MSKKQKSSEIDTEPATEGQIALQLDVQELNLILRSLAKHPFEEVVMLIEKIRNQAVSQIS